MLDYEERDCKIVEQWSDYYLLFFKRFFSSFFAFIGIENRFYWVEICLIALNGAWDLVELFAFLFKSSLIDQECESAWEML